jgi:hypothetical protein
VEAVGVAALPRRGTDGRREVMDFGIGARGIGGVLAQEAVDDAACGAASECSCQRDGRFAARERVADFARTSRSRASSPTSPGVVAVVEEDTDVAGV